MPFPPQDPRRFTRVDIEALNPGQPGVYGLIQRGLYSSTWIYIGQSKDIRERLLEHLNGDNECINRNWPTHFVGELVEGGVKARRKRERELIDEYGPICNVA